LRRTPRRPLVLIVDGLDEAEGWDIGPDLFPLDPPRGIRVVVSARSLADDKGAAGWRRRLRWSDALARSLELGPLSREGVADLVAATQRFVNVTQSRLADRLMQVTDGDPLLLSLYIEQLRMPDDVEVFFAKKIPVRPGLDAFFKDWWEDQARLWGEQDSDLEAVTYEVLTWLSCAKGPMTRNDLAELIELKPPLDSRKLDRAISDLRRLLVSAEGLRGFVFTHPELATYFRGQRSAGELARCWERIRDCGRESRRKLANDPKFSVPSYLLLHLSRHLADLHDVDALLDLIDDPHWFNAQAAGDRSHTTFGNDVRLGWDEAAAFGGQRAMLASIRCALVATSLNSLAIDLPAEVLDGLVATDQWSVAEALAAARRGSDGIARARCILRIANRLPDGSDRAALHTEVLQMVHTVNEDDESAFDIFVEWMKARPDNLVAEARDLIKHKFGGINQFPGLTKLLTYMPLDEQNLRSEIARDAFDAAKQLPEESGDLKTNERVRALADLLPLADPDLASEITRVALASARRCLSTSERAISLARVAKEMKPQSRTKIVAEAFALAQVEDWEQGPAKALVELAPLLTPKLFPRALRACAALRWLRGRVNVLEAFAPFLPATMVNNALKLADESLEVDLWRDKCKVAIISRIAELDDVDRALGLISSLQGSWADAASNQIIIMVARKDRARAVALARQISSPWFRLSAYASTITTRDDLTAIAVRGALSAARHEKLSGVWDDSSVSTSNLSDAAEKMCAAGYVDEALELADMLPTFDHLSRSELYARMVDRVFGDRKRDVVRTAVDSRRVIGDLETQARALAFLAAYVPDASAALISDAVGLARLVGMKRRRIETLADLLLFLDGKLGDEVAQEIVHALPELDNAYGIGPLSAQVVSRIGQSRPKLIVDALSRASDSHNRQVWLVSRTAAVLDETYLPDVLQIILQLPIIQRCEALQSVLPRLSEPQRSTLLEQTFAEVETLALTMPGGGSPRALAFVPIAGQLGPQQIDRAIDLINSLADDDRDEPLAALAPRVADLGDPRSLNLVEAIASSYFRRVALAEVVPHLPPDLLQSATQIMLAIQPLYRRDAVVACAQRCSPGESPDWLWEAVYAAVTPDAWAGAKDHTRALQELAPMVTPPLVERVLEHCGNHPYARVRALALAHLAHFLPEHRRDEAYANAIACAESEDVDNRATLLAVVGALVPSRMLRRVVEGIMTVPRSPYETSHPRSEALLQLSPRLVGLDLSELRSVTEVILKASRGRKREEILWDLSALGQILARIGQSALVAETVQAIKAIALRWP
jgi:hypothetical protein